MTEKKNIEKILEIKVQNKYQKKKSITRMRNTKFHQKYTVTFFTNFYHKQQY